MTPSRKPRRSFAAPLILTVAAVPACVVASNKPATSDPKNTPEQRDHRTGEGGENANPPGPHVNPPMQRKNEYDEKWSVSLQDDGTCLAHADDGGCPEGASCNPPPPRPVLCPDGIQEGQWMSMWAVQGETGCWVSAADTGCPSNAKCNPPPPQATSCPE